MTDNNAKTKRVCINCDFYYNSECYSHPPEIFQLGDVRIKEKETFQTIPKVEPDRTACTFFQVGGEPQ